MNFMHWKKDTTEPPSRAMQAGMSLLAIEVGSKSLREYATAANLLMKTGEIPFDHPLWRLSLSNAHSRFSSELQDRKQSVRQAVVARTTVSRRLYRVASPVTRRNT